MAFIHETKAHFEQDISHHHKDRRAFAEIIKIDNELIEVHNLHSGLLKESIELKTSALEAARESLYYVGLSSFNFDQEIVRKIMGIPMPLEESKLMAQPFLTLRKAKIWSPMSLFAPQWINIDKDEEDHLHFLSADDQEIKKEVVYRQKIFKRLFEEIYPHMLIDGKIDIQTTVEKLGEPFISVRELYDFFIIIHQIAPINIDEIIKQKAHIFSLAFESLKDSYDRIEAIERDGTLAIFNNYFVKNIQLSLITKEAVHKEISE